MAAGSRWKGVFFAFLFLLLFAAAWTWSGPCPIRAGARPTAREIEPLPAGRVLLITLDGVRERDLATVWPTLGKRLRADGFFFGASAERESMYVSNSSIRSFAGYSSLSTGRYDRSCWTNDCARPTRTLIDALLDSGVPADRVAVIASWGRLERAVESAPRALQSVGLDSLRNADSLSAEFRARVAAQEQLARAALPSWPEARRDTFTWSIARDFLRTGKWRFAHVSLLDSDELGHLNQFDSYLSSLREYERWFLELLDDPTAFGPRRDVSIVITTDHGRGRLVFAQHGWWEPTSSRIWAAVLPSPAARAVGLRKRVAGAYRQVDLRPTIEFLLGRALDGPREGDPLVVRGPGQGAGTGIIPSESGLNK